MQYSQKLKKFSFCETRYLVSFRHFAKSILEKEYYISSSLFFGKTIYLKKIFDMVKIARNHHNCLHYESVLKILYFHILNING